MTVTVTPTKYVQTVLTVLWDFKFLHSIIAVTTVCTYLVGVTVTVTGRSLAVTGQGHDAGLNTCA